MSVQLANISYYSLCESLLSIEDLIKYCFDNGQKAIGLCDHNVMYGSMAFYRKCLRNNIKPIIGLTVDLDFNDSVSSIVLYAKNNNGYKKLIYFSTLLNTTKKALCLKDLNNNDDLITIIPSKNSLLDHSLLNNDVYCLENDLLKYNSYFNNLYIGLSSEDEVFYHNHNKILKEMCKKLKIKTCAFNYSLMSNKEDSFYLKSLKALYYKTNIYDPNLVEDKYAYLHTPDELIKLYDEQDLLNCVEIADECNLDLDANHCELLKYPNDKNVTSREYLTQLCLAGLKKRFNDQEINGIYLKRLKYELSVISSMNYDDYFLIVYDFILFARKHDIYVGPGRGSAAGSLVSYSLGITHVDPIKYGLLFERFLNPERISMPDIDVDFPDDKRNEVIKYVTEKYGKDKVAHIIAFSTLQARAAIDSACEALRVDKRKLESVKRYLPKFNSNKSESTLKKLLSNINLITLIKSDDELKKVYDLAMKLEGFPKNITTHACGIVISDKPLINVIPLCQVNEETLSTQISADYLEELGLLKIDFLGIRNLTIIDEVCKMINPKLDILKINIDDSLSYKLIGEGQTIGVFQLEQPGMINHISKIKPQNLEELADAIALYRPGAMDNIPLYLKNRRNKENIEYIHKDLKDILQSTYGVIVYQEQAMLIAQKIAGFSLGKADVLRKAMGKKKEKDLLALKDDFINGAIRNGYDSALAYQLYDFIFKFSGYGFNKSHACAYALVAYQMAYLKSHFPLYFLCNMLNNVIGSDIKTYEYLMEGKKMNINFLPLSINHSFNNFSIEGDGIRVSLRTIKNIGNSIVNNIIEEREKNGLFKDYLDFVCRCNLIGINKSTIELLIKAGALDEFKLSRNSLLLSLNDCFEYASLIKIDNPNQTYLDFDLIAKPKLTIASDNQIVLLNNEKEVLGFYLSKHPICYLKDKYNNHNSLINLIPNQNIKLLVRITKIKKYLAKTGEMAFIEIEDNTTSIDAVILPNKYSIYYKNLFIDNFYEIDGKTDKREDKLSFLVNSLKKIDL